MKQEGQKSKITKMKTGSSRGRTPEGKPNPVDVFVGKKLRQRRLSLGISLEQLAAQMGMTFQQLRKYECGANRISASRLWDLAGELDVSIDFFFEGMDAETASLSPRRFSPWYERAAEFERFLENIDDPMLKKETGELVQAYYEINDRDVALSLRELISAMARATA